MKKSFAKLFFTVLFFTSFISFAQGINKVSLLNELNKTYGIELTATEKNTFENTNIELISGLLSLDEKNLSKEIRSKEIDKLFDKRDKSLTSSLGINKYSDIKAKTDEKNQEIIQKIKQGKITP
ncbi:hypothetical protein [Flavobacterium adhaerens]|uniref:hypothetical protein n=1 Tax=Flavobacterium adhaerens TaxID=3149043 RepID=UPI0032B53CA0